MLRTARAEAAAAMLSVHGRAQPALGSRNVLQPGSCWHQPGISWCRLLLSSIFPHLIAAFSWHGKRRGGGLPGGDNSPALLNLQDQIVLAQIGHSQLASKQPISVENNTMANSPSESRALSQLPIPTGPSQAPPTHLCLSVTNLPPKCATNTRHVPPCLCSGCAGPVPGLCTTTASPEKLPADGL